MLLRKPRALRPYRVYVTHSPFLIDKNHGDRIRVLEKGVGEEGTRVVRDPSRNHYEPLRSAFGSFVGETTFIGNCNLIVDGPADQILLAGAASHLRSKGTADIENIDLNHITIVPASGAPHVRISSTWPAAGMWKSPLEEVQLTNDRQLTWSVKPAGCSAAVKM